MSTSQALTKAIYDVTVTHYQHDPNHLRPPLSARALAQFLADALDLVMEPDESLGFSVLSMDRADGANSAGTAHPKDGAATIAAVLENIRAALRRVSDSISERTAAADDFDCNLSGAENVGALNAAEQIIATVRDQWNRIAATEKDASI